MSVHRRAALRLGLSLCALGAPLAAGACAGGDLPAEVPAHRPWDGLLGDPDLQAVVDDQVRRDGTALVVSLASERAPVRARAAFALGSVQDPAAVPALVAALGDPDAGVRRDAAFALGQAHAPEAVPPLADAFAREADGMARGRILEALGKVPSRTAATTLYGLEVRPGEEAPRTLALARLGAVGGVATAETQDFLLDRLDDADPEVRRAAAYYFGRLPGAGPWAARAPRVRQALDSYRPGAPEAMYLVQALGKLADPQDGPRLREWLSGATDWRIRANAAVALGALPPDATNRAILLEALDDVSPLVSDQAAHALGRGSLLPSELPPLEAWVSDHPDRRPAVAPLLVVLAKADEGPFVLAWLDALSGDDVWGWTAGLPALAYLAGRDPVDRLIRAAGSDEPRIQATAVSTLVRRWSQDRFLPGYVGLYFQAFSDALRGGSVQAASQAAGALADPMFAPLGSVAALGDAFRAMKAPEDLEAMTAVLDALGTSASPDALGVVRGALVHPAPEVRHAAARALAALGGDAPAPSEAEEAPSLAAGAGTTPAVEWAYLAGLGVAPRWVLETNRGRVVVRLDPEEAPLTVQTLARLSEAGRYDGVPFHRVVPNFVVQGGDVTSGDGSGGPGFTIP
ncbi:MAG TPA: HEAT repeat domain-containing protein, partial [Longimicrobiales bacterium]|nr:HEAT repeat domain-containing protein [Longimicrobiales bacterium]